jgi:hypothetical protein
MHAGTIGPGQAGILSGAQSTRISKGVEGAWGREGHAAILQGAQRPTPETNRQPLRNCTFWSFTPESNQRETFSQRAYVVVRR